MSVARGSRGPPRSRERGAGGAGEVGDDTAPGEAAARARRPGEARLLSVAPLAGQWAATESSMSGLPFPGGDHLYS